MRNVFALAVALTAALGGSLLAAAPAHATDISTCVVTGSVTAGPGGVSVGSFEVHSVADCLG
jgi:hypothetical protein